MVTNRTPVAGARAVVRNEPPRQGEWKTKTSGSKTEGRVRNKESWSRTKPRPGDRSGEAVRTARERPGGALPTLVNQVINGEVWQLANRDTMSESQSFGRQRRFTVEQAFVVLSLAIAATILLVFGIDLLNGWTLNRYSLAMDFTYLFCGIVLGYLSWHVYREQS